MKNVVLKNLLTVTSRIKTNLEIYYILIITKLRTFI